MFREQLLMSEGRFWALFCFNMNKESIFMRMPKTTYWLKCLYLFSRNQLMT